MNTKYSRIRLAMARSDENSGSFYEDYLEHHGIKGQHWYVRRFQNEDGTYTPAGRDRYGIGDEKTISSKEYKSIRKSSKTDEKDFRAEKKQALRGLKGSELQKTKAYYDELESGMAKSRAVLERNAGHSRAAVRFEEKARRLEESGEDNKALRRSYNRDMKKLKKLYNRTDVDQQQQNIEKYDRRVDKAMKVGKIATGVSAAGFGTMGAMKAINNHLGAKTKAEINRLYDAADKVISKADADVHSIWSEASKAGKFTPGKGYTQDVWDKVDAVMNKALADDDALTGQAKALKENFNKAAGVRKTVADVGKYVGIAGAATAVGAFGTAAYNKIQSNAAKKRLTEIGHDKAVQKYREQYDTLLNKYSGTSYSDLLKAEIKQYKKEHPNTQLSDKQIAKNLG